MSRLNHLCAAVVVAELAAACTLGGGMATGVAVRTPRATPADPPELYVGPNAGEPAPTETEPTAARA